MPSAAELPEIFRAYFAGLEEQRVATRPDDTFHHCFGCGPAHPDGLRVRCYRTGEGVASPIIIAQRYEGPPGGAHGGIVAAYLDEVLAAAAARASGHASVTGELTVRYVKPVPTETPLLGRGRLVTDHGRYIDVEGSLETFAGQAVLAKARGRFFPIGR
jgi:acyl-coenzyme A thioesterase PaaI-like protein